MTYEYNIRLIDSCYVASVSGNGSSITELFHIPMFSAFWYIFFCPTGSTTINWSKAPQTQEKAIKWCKETIKTLESSK